MNFQNTAPTEYDDLNCVHMRINYAEDQTDDVVEHYNWKGDLCDLNADGDLGEHSRIVHPLSQSYDMLYIIWTI